MPRFQRCTIGTTFDLKSRHYEELHLINVVVSPELRFFFHSYIGAYASVGYAFRYESDGNRDDGISIRSGLIANIPLSTRSALQIQGGVSYMKFSTAYNPVGYDLAIGFAVF
jgi:hypothetical protein